MTENKPFHIYYACQLVKDLIAKITHDTIVATATYGPIIPGTVVVRVKDRLTVNFDAAGNPEHVTSINAMAFGHGARSFVDYESGIIVVSLMPNALPPDAVAYVDYEYEMSNTP